MPRTLQHSSGIDGIVESVYQLGRIMRRRMVSCGSGEIHMGQIHALFLIQERAGLTMKELAQALRVSSPSATSFVDRLVKLRLVERIHDQQNRRLVRLKITPEGFRFMNEKLEQRRKIFSEVLGTLSAKDQTDLLEILRKILSVSPS